MPKKPRKNKNVVKGGGNIKRLEKEKRKLRVRAHEAEIYNRTNYDKTHHGIRGRIVRVSDFNVNRYGMPLADPLVFFYATRLFKLLLPDINVVHVSAARASKPM